MGREGREHTDGKGAGGAGAQFGDAARDAVQCIADGAGELATLLGQSS